MNLNFQRIMPHLIAVLLMLVATIAYFSPQLQGKVLQQGDIVNVEGMAHEADLYKAETGNDTYWTNSMFGGMPTYQIRGHNGGNLLEYSVHLMRLFFAAPIGVFFVTMLCFYLFMLLIGVHSWLALAGAIAFGLSTNSMILWEAGHTSKVHTLSYLSLMMAGVILTMRKNYLAGGVVFAFGCGLNVFANHPQMTYYFGLTLILFAIIYAVHLGMKGELTHLLKSGAFLILAGLIGVGASSAKLWSTYEYSRDTMRGQPILKVTSDEPKSSSETEGLEWTYAMSWSHDLIDLAAGLVPGAAGGSSVESFRDDFAIKKSMQKKGANVDRGPMYWGKMPSTSGPSYIGAVFIFLFILGLLVVKGPLKWWFALATLLTVLISMGKNAAWLNQLLFDYMPMFNKFRSHSSIMGVTGFLVAGFGVFGLSEMFKQKEKGLINNRALYIALGISGGVCALIALIGPSMSDFNGPSDVRIASAGWDVDAIKADRASMMRGDGFRSLMLILLSAALIWAYLNDKLKQAIAIGGLGLLMTFDMWGVAKRYLNSDDWLSERTYENNFKERPVDTQIKKDMDLNYRVLDMTVNTFNTAAPSYHHKTIGGYHAAKLQRYQDVVDYYISSEIYDVTRQLDLMSTKKLNQDSVIQGLFSNTRMLNLMNMKYAILGRAGSEVPVSNPHAYGNAWLISKVQPASDANEEIDKVKMFDMKRTAVVHNEFKDYVSGIKPSGAGNISLSSYKPNHLVYDANVSSDELAVFSEIWYGPDKGWQAYIDGSPVDHIRANYVMRALKIPAGQHKVEFKFDPASMKTGRMLGLACSALILLSLIWLLFNYFKNLPPAEVKAKTVKATTSKVVSKKKKKKKGK